MLLNSFLILEVSSWTLVLSPFNSLDFGVDRTSSSSCGQKLQTWPYSFIEGLPALASCIRVVVEKDDDEGDGGDGGGLLPFPLFPPPGEPSPFGGLELSPCNLVFLSS